MHEILKLSHIKTEYKWVENKHSLKKALYNYLDSGYRYLHLSFHGNSKGIEVNGEFLTNRELSSMLKGKLENKRVFISSFKGANQNLAKYLIINGNAYYLVDVL